VTPTSVGFGGGGPAGPLVSGLPQPGQASPSRGLLPISSRGGVIGPQRPIGSMGDMMNRPGPLGVGSGRSGLGSFGMGGAGRLAGGPQSMMNVFGAGDNAPPQLDLSEFPSLSNRAHGEPPPSPAISRTPYVGMVKQQTNESSEFTMSSEDFPALPGSQPERANQSDQGMENSGSLAIGGSSASKQQKQGIQTHPDGKVTNIPASMVADQFGMVGFLSFIRTAETDQNIVQLAQGSDLTTLGLNLKSPENQYLTFGGAWAEAPCRAQDIDFYVPREYLTNGVTREKLAQISLNRYGEDLLFHIFYMNAGDVLQILAARELYNRDWRYLKEERVWITRAPGIPPVEKTQTYERGTYYYFDAQNWRKVAKEFCVDYDKLEDRPERPHHPSSFPGSASV